MGASEGWRAASEGLLHKVRMSGLREMAGAEKPGIMAARFAKRERQRRWVFAQRLGPWGKWGAHCVGSQRHEGRPGQRYGTGVSGTRCLPVLGPWDKMEEEQRMFKKSEQSR